MEKWTIYLVIGIVTVGLVVGGLTMSKKESTQETITQSFTTLGDGSVEIVPVNTDGYAYATNNTEYSAYFKQYSNWGDGVKYCVDVNGVEKCLVYQPQDMSYRDVYGSQDYLGSINNVQAVINGSTITYPNAFSNVDLTYTLTSNKMKENFVLKSKPRNPAGWLTPPITLDFGGYIKYDEDISVWISTEEKIGNFVTDDIIEFRYNNTPIFTLPLPIMTDSVGNSIYGEYEVQKKGNQIWFYVRTPYDFINKSVYPLFIDPTVNVIISNNNDDAEENIGTGAVSTSSSDLELLVDGSASQAVGIIFRNVEIPQGSTINSAFIQFYFISSGLDSDPMYICVEDVINPNTYSSSTNNITNRNYWSTCVEWSVDELYGNLPTGDYFNSTDVSVLVQHMTDKVSWDSNDSIGFMFNATNLTAWGNTRSRNGNAGQAPKLIVDYTAGGSPPASVNNWVDCTSNPVTNESKSYNSSFFVNGTGTWSIKHDIVLDKFNFTDTCNVDVYNVGSLTLT